MAGGGGGVIKPVDSNKSVQTTQNLYVSGNIGIGTSGPAYPLDVNGSIATNKLLLRTADYTRNMPNIQYQANTWYEAIPAGSLLGGVYIVTLQFNTTAPSTPWNLFGSFLHFAGITNYNQANYLSGAPIPTSMHTNTGNAENYQISVRGNYAGNAIAGVELLIAGTPIGTGTWIVNAYKII